jgi:hypothetical protein
MYGHAWIFINKFFKFCILGILYNAIMHKCEFDQDYCIDLLKRIPNIFILHFYEFYPNLHEFWKFG